MTSIGSPPFGTLLRRYRIAARLTQEDLAARTGVSVRTISDLERGVIRRSRHDTLALLAEPLALSAQDLASFRAAAHAVSHTSFSATTTPLPRAAPPHTLPLSLTPLTPLVGREREEALVVRLLRHEKARLLTLIGPAGIGKTRLAWQVAVGLSDAFADGVCFVDLAPIRESHLVLPTVARALGIRDVGSQPIAETLTSFLHDKHLLLLLDNFEQVAAAATEVTTLLATCPNITALVTSRAVLNVRGEQELAVQSLAVPDPHPAPLPPMERLGQYPAVALFVQRAHAIKPTFTLTAANAPTVVAICRRLDGLPLAIELAAARIKLLSLSELLARLEHWAELLTGGPRDLPERQRSLSRAIGWSYDLLNAEEQTLWRRLAVFVGSWTLEAAGAVCWDDVCDRELGVLVGLGPLVDKSLVQQDDSGEDLRFQMLATIREYGLEQLEASGEVTTLRERHATYYLARAERAERELTGPEQAEWMEHLSRDLDNLRAALHWARERTDCELGLRMAGALFRYWVARAAREGRDWLEDLLALDAKAVGRVSSRAARVKALNAASYLAHRQGDFATTQTLAEEGLVLSRQLGDAQGAAGALANLGNAAQGQGNYERSTACYVESVALRREMGDTSGVATVLNNLAINAVLAHGGFALAVALYQEALSLQRSVGNRAGEATALLNLGIMFTDKGDFEQAIIPIEASLALFRNLKDTGGAAHALQSLGALARRRGHLAQATVHLRESIELNRTLDNKGLLVITLEEMAALAGAQGRPAQAARLYGRAEALRDALGNPVPPGSRASYDRDIAQVRAALGEREFAVAWAAGRGMPLDQAVGSLEAC